MMTYAETWEVIAEYSTRECLEMFADGWGRFPSELTAGVIINQLERDQQFWQNRRPEVGEQIKNAIAEIKGRVTIREAK